MTDKKGKDRGNDRLAFVTPTLATTTPRTKTCPWGPRKSKGVARVGHLWFLDYVRRKHPKFCGSCEEGEELALLLVVLLDAAAEDVVVPAVDFDLAGGEGSGYGGLDFEVEVLGDDVAADDGG